MSALLRDRALVIAHTQVGRREQGGKNTGPEVDAYLRAVGLPPGHPWCAAFAVWCYQEAAKALGQPMLLARTGKVSRLFLRMRERYGRATPVIGAIYGHAKDPADPESKGHCGIVIALTRTSFWAIEGNTNDRGSTDGTEVCERPRKMSYANLGFLDLGSENTVRIRPPLVA